MCTYLCYLSGGEDFGPLPMECTLLSFSGTDSQQCCVIPITDDNMIEGTESFTVALTTPITRLPNANLIAPTLATVSITDNDGEFPPLYPPISPPLHLFSL